VVYTPSPVEIASASDEAALFTAPLTRTQCTLFDLVCAVRNVRDEDDLQHLAFLATEFGILRQSPFCFSRFDEEEVDAPRSLVLRDSLHALMDHGLILWDGSSLRARGGMTAFVTGVPPLHRSISWLGALSPLERRVMTRTALDLHGTGVSLLSRQAEVPFRRAVSAGLSGTENAEVAVGHLSAVRWQLSFVQ